MTKVRVLTQAVSQHSGKRDRLQPVIFFGDFCQTDLGGSGAVTFLEIVDSRSDGMNCVSCVAFEGRLY